MLTSNVMLAVDTSEPALLEQKKELEKVGISVFRVDSMQEAISRFARGEEYLCVVINEDSITDFMDLLPVLCDIAKTHVFVTTHTYTKAKHTEAMQHGADAYVAFGMTAREDALCAVEHLKLPMKWANRAVKNIPVYACGDIALIPRHHKALIGNMDVILTPKESAILLYFVSNAGIILDSDTIYISIWNCDADESSPGILWTHITRLRKKLNDVSPKYSDLIETVRGVGYKFNG